MSEAPPRLELSEARPTAHPRPRVRPNPFAFPSDTDFRFWLLIVSVLGAGLLLFAVVFETLPWTGEYKRAEYARCTRLADPDDLSGSYRDMVTRSATNSDCTRAVDRAEAFWMLGGLALLLTAAGVLYWSSPWRKIRRDRLEPLPPDAVSGLGSCLEELCREAELAERPIFLWSPLNTAASGVAFGRLGQYHVSLTGGLVVLYATDRARFRAIMLHELAHLHNADVDKTYLSVAVWEAFLALALLPSAASLAFSRSAGDALALGWRMLPLAALVFVTRNAVLRARERYADVRASVWDGPEGALDRVLAELPRMRGPWWRRVLDFHPSASSRRRTLADPSRLLRIGFWESFGTGLAAGLALPNVVRLMGLLVPLGQIPVRPLVAALLFVPLAVGVIGVGTWRSTFAAMVRGQRPRGVGRLGLGLGVGFVLGENLSFAAVDFSKSAWALSGGPLLLLELLWGGVLVLLLVPFVYWIRTGAASWLEVAAGASSPRPAYRLGLSVAAGLLTVWVGLLFVVYLALRTGGRALTSSDFATRLTEAIEAAGTGSNADTAAMLEVLIGSRVDAASVDATSMALLTWLLLVPLLTMVVLWAFPLSAWLWRRIAAAPGSASWAWLEPGLAAAPARRQSARLRPDRALIAGAVGGLVGVLLLLVAQVRIWPLVATVDGAWLIFLLLPIGLQAAVAAVVAAWIERAGALHGLMAGFVAGSIAELGWTGVWLMLGVERLDDPALTATQFVIVLTFGSLLALPVALGASAAAGLVRRR
ncbi:MAG TPA: M48 family metalloprotease [Chloroflexota bacterium]